MKKRYLILIILLLFFPCELFSSTQTFLKLDTKAHMGLIRDVLVTKDKKYLISASEDKTIRIWNIKNRKEAAKILGEIGPGHQGKIFAIALSPDDKYLAVGGYLNSYGNYDYGKIRVYDFRSGKLLWILESHENSVFDLNFNKTGEYLVSGSSDKTIKIWKRTVTGFELFKTYSNHEDAVYGVGFLKKYKANSVVSCGFDGKINLYDLDKNSILSKKTENKIQNLAISRDYIAVCGVKKEINIYDYNLRLIKKIKTEITPKSLAFSGDGKYLAAGSGKFPYKCVVFNTYLSFKKTIELNNHKNTIAAVNFIGSDTIVSAGGKNKEIFIWDVNTGKTKGEIHGKGNIIWGVGINGKKIGFGTKYDVKGRVFKDQSSLTKAIDLNDFRIVKPVENLDKFKRISKSYKDLTLSHKVDEKNQKPNGVLEIRKKGELAGVIKRGSKNGYGHYCYGFTDKGVIISGGNGGNLKAYLEDGTEIVDFVGHTGTVWSIAADGDVLVSGSSDQTIKLWNLKEIKKSRRYYTRIYPFLTIFVSVDDEWVVWSRSGYYNSSVGGDEYVGFHANNGTRKEADFYNADRFYKTYYKPSIIKKIAELKNEDDALFQSNKDDDFAYYDSGKILPPKIILNTKKDLVTNESSVEIDFYVDSNSSNKITDIRIFNNGREIITRGIKRIKSDSEIIHIREKVELTQKKNIIKIIAENKYSVSNPEYINVEYIERIKNIFKPTLYGLAIGVSNYKDKGLNLDYPAKDAFAVSDILKNQKKGLYRDIKIEFLHNEKATRFNILKGLHRLKKEATQKDVVLIFLAGHGLNDEFENYFFLPHDAKKEFLNGSAVKWSEFVDVIKTLPSKVILMADACHSGNIMGGKKRSADITGALKGLLSAGTGQVIMTSTTGSSVAYEDPRWGHGAFTKAITEGLRGMADYDCDGVITIKELDFYVTFRVKDLTKGRQKPTTIIPSSIPDFPFAIK